MGLRVGSDYHLTEWHVAFCDIGNPNFIQKFLKRGFRHVWMFTFDPDSGAWIMFQPTWNNAVIRAVPAKDFTPFLMEALDKGPILCVKVTRRGIKKARLFMTCVSQVCHVLGVDLFFATPYRLFCELQKSGYQARFTLSDEIEE